MSNVSSTRDWKVLRTLVGPEQIFPPNTPTHRLERARRVAVQISYSVDFNRKKNREEARFSYRLGWVNQAGDEKSFMPASHQPDDRVLEFIEIQRQAATMVSVVTANLNKAQSGTLTAKIGEALKVG